VFVKKDECYLIQVDMSYVNLDDLSFLKSRMENTHALGLLSWIETLQEEYSYFQELQKKPSIEAEKAILKNDLFEKNYFGLPPIVCMTWLGMISSDI
jgi:hypothetical protein